MSKTKTKSQDKVFCGASDSGVTFILYLDEIKPMPRPRVFSRRGKTWTYMDVKFRSHFQGVVSAFSDLLDDLPPRPWYITILTPMKIRGDRDNVQKTVWDALQKASGVNDREYCGSVKAGRDKGYKIKVESCCGHES